MAAETFEYRYFIDAPAEQIYAHLAEPGNYVGLSPLVVEVRDVEHRRDEQGRAVVRYLSVERFLFLGILRYDNPIRVTTTLTQPPEQMVSDVNSPFSVDVRFVFDLAPSDGAEGAGTWIRETVTATMPRLLKGFVVGEAKRVQRERARILTERMTLDRPFRGESNRV